MFAGLGVSIVGLERALLHYTKEPTVTPFDIKTVPIDTTPLIPKQSKKVYITYSMVNSGCSNLICIYVRDYVRTICSVNII